MIAGDQILALVQELKALQAAGQPKDVDTLLVQVHRRLVKDPIYPVLSEVLSPASASLLLALDLYFIHKNDWTAAEKNVLESLAEKNYVPDEANITKLRAAFQAITRLGKFEEALTNGQK
jgi:hypothetical protein